MRTFTHKILGTVLIQLDGFSGELIKIEKFAVPSIRFTGRVAAADSHYIRRIYISDIYISDK